MGRLFWTTYCCEEQMRVTEINFVISFYRLVISSACRKLRHIYILKKILISFAWTYDISRDHKQTQKVSINFFRIQAISLPYPNLFSGLFMFTYVYGLRTCDQYPPPINFILNIQRLRPKVIHNFGTIHKITALL